MPNHVTNQLSIEGPGAHEFLMRFINKEGLFDFNKVVVVPEELNIPESSWVEMAAGLLIGVTPHWAKGMSSDDLPAAWEAAKELMGNQFEQNLTWGKQYLANLQKYGHGSWYGMNREAWGTKWNAYEQVFPVEQVAPVMKGPKIETYGGSFYRSKRTAYHKRVLKKRQKRARITSCQFDTAWSTPEGVWLALAEQMPPGLSAHVRFADEDTGSNCGEFTLTREGVFDRVISPGWSTLDKEGRRRWVEFALSITDPDTSVEEYFSEIEED